ncbi:MAG TPA: hypothetical protein VIK00_04470 [Candidatus Limnocylindrales bacterium]
MAMVQHAIERSRTVWLEILILALITVVAAVVLTLIFNGPGAPNAFNITTDPGAGLYPW